MLSRGLVDQGHLRTLLRDFGDLPRRLAFDAPDLLVLQRLNRELETRHSRTEGAGLTPDVIEVSYRALRESRNAASPLQGLGIRHLRWMPFALFYPAGDSSLWLAND